MQNNHSNPSQSDDIDLLQLAQALWASKWLIVSCSAVAALLAALYLFFVAQPRYAISVYLDEPTATSLEGLNQGRQLVDANRKRERQPLDLDPFTPEQVFKVFTRYLTSTEAAQQLIHQVLSYAQDTQISSSALEQNDWRVKITPPSAKGREQYQVTVQAEDSALAQKNLALFLGIVQAEALESILDEAGNTVRLHVNSIESQIATERAAALKQRQDRIAQLGEALIVAEAIAQDGPQMNLGRSSSPSGLSRYVDGSELYARGARALKAELEVLEAREDDDPFIPNLRQKEAQLDKLKTIAPDTSSLMLYSIDGQVLMPENPVHPRKALTLLLAIVLGGMFGVFWALVRYMLRSRRLSP